MIKFLVSSLRVIAWLVGVALSLLLFVLDYFSAQRTHNLSINGVAIWGRDFVNVFTSGRLVIEGRLADLYDINAYQAWQTAEFGWGIHDHNYSYPPITLLYTPLFGALPYLWSLALWTLVSLLLFGLAARPWLTREKLPAWLSMILPTTLICVWAGHYALIMGALWLSAWHHLEKRPKLAGLMTGLMIIKPHMAVLMPLMLLRRRAWSAIAAATATVFVLTALSVLIFGIGLWETYFGQTSGQQLKMAAATKTFFIKMMPTITPALFSYGLSAPIVWAIQIGVAVSIVAILWKFHPADSHRAGLATAVATFLILPYAFNYDMTVVGLAAALTLCRPKAPQYPWQTVVAAFAFVLPAAVLPLNRNGFWFAPLLLAIFLIVMLLRPNADVNAAPQKTF